MNDTERPEPAADAVERAAKAIHKINAEDFPELYGTWEEEVEREKSSDTFTYVEFHRRIARAVLECDHSDDDWLDDLRAIHSEARLVNLYWHHDRNVYEATVHVPYHAGWDGKPPYKKYDAIDESPITAIRNAVEKARKVQSDEQ